MSEANRAGSTTTNVVVVYAEFAKSYIAQPKDGATVVSHRSGAVRAAAPIGAQAKPGWAFRPLR